MSKMEPLTAEEQELAEQHLYLVDQFLQRKRLDPQEYYDVVIFGYLQAIQQECRRNWPEENKNFHGLAEVCMRSAVFMEWRRQSQNMRKGDREKLSLDCTSADMDDGEFSLYEIVADTRQRTEIQVEAKDLAERVLAVATAREREAIDLARLGYEAREIADILGIARNTASRTLYNFRVKAKAVRDDREVIRSPQWARDKEKFQARNRAYQQAHREEINERRRIWAHAYRAAHPEKVRAKERAYREAHKEEINASRRARRAAKRAEKRAQIQEQEKAAPDAANIRDGWPEGQN